MTLFCLRMVSFVEILVALLLGVGSGVVTGLIPGIHVNLITVLILSVAPVLLVVVDVVSVVVYIISLAITHSFLDAIPSIYLGAPDEAQALNALPGHRLLMRGEGHNAIVYTLIGSLGTLLVSLLLFAVFLFLMGVIAERIEGLVGYILIGVMAYMIWRSTGKRLKSLCLFLLSGGLGLLVFSIPTLSQPLFSLLSGLFGVSLLIVSLESESGIPIQREKKLKLRKGAMMKAVGAASGVGFIAAFLPGFSSSQAAIVATEIVGDIGDEGFLTLVGGINTANMLISIGTVYLLDKARNGAIVGVRELLGVVDFSMMGLLLIVALVVGGISVLVALGISKWFAKIVSRVPYQGMVLSVIGFIVFLSLVFDGWLGLLILAVSAALGILSSIWGVGKNHLMGCLIVPVILFFVL